MFPSACLMLDAVVFILIVKHDGLALLGILLSVAAGVIALQTAGSVYLFAPRLSARLVWIYSRLLGETLSTTHERIEALIRRQRELVATQADASEAKLG